MPKISYPTFILCPTSIKESRVIEIAHQSTHIKLLWTEVVVVLQRMSIISSFRTKCVDTGPCAVCLSCTTTHLYNRMNISEEALNMFPHIVSALELFPHIHVLWSLDLCIVTFGFSNSKKNSFLQKLYEEIRYSFSILWIVQFILVDFLELAMK